MQDVPACRIGTLLNRFIPVVHEHGCWHAKGLLENRKNPSLMPFRSTAGYSTHHKSVTLLTLAISVTTRRQHQNEYICLTIDTGLLVETSLCDLLPGIRNHVSSFQSALVLNTWYQVWYQTCLQITCYLVVEFHQVHSSFNLLFKTTVVDIRSTC